MRDENNILILHLLEFGGDGYLKNQDEVLCKHSQIYQSVPSSELEPPPPSPASEYPPPNQRRGNTLACEWVRGWGESQFGRLEKKLSTLSTLWQTLDYG